MLTDGVSIAARLIKRLGISATKWKYEVFHEAWVYCFNHGI